MRLIGITGKALSGKSTVAGYLAERHNFTRVRFAETLKSMGKAFGLTQEQVDGAEKEIPLEILCGKTPREFLQWLGTDFGRNMIGEDIWVRAWRHKVDNLLNLGITHIVADDVRFPNEVAAIYKLGGFVVRISRPGSSSIDIGQKHESETHELEYDAHIINDGDLCDLFRKVDLRLTNRT